MEKTRYKKCVICKQKYSGYGNNAEPLAKGSCCDNCNVKVIVERVKQIIHDDEERI